MRKTRLSLLLLAVLAGCVGDRTPLLDGHRSKPDSGLRTQDAGVDRQADRASADTKPALPDLALDRALDQAQLDTLRPDSLPDRPVDSPIPDTRPFGLDLLPDRPIDLPAPDLRLPDTLVKFDTLPDRPMDRPPSDAPGPDLPAWEVPRLDLAPDLGSDRPADVAVDTAVPDVGPDTPPDAGQGDTMASCLPGTPYILGLGDDGWLYRFDPSSISLVPIAEVNCGNGGLNSLTASPRGLAYISTTRGQLCSLDVRTFETTLTSFDPSLIGSTGYGMTLLSDSSPKGQSLYIAINNNTKAELKVVNLSSYTFGDIGPIEPAIPRTELTAGPHNGLYALYPYQPSALLHLDPLTATSIETVTLPNSNSGSFALVYWEDSFYLFMEQPGDPAANGVFRYRPSDGLNTQVGTLPVQLIGAAVALCQ